MTPRQEVLKLIEKHEASFYDNTVGGGLSATVWSPPGEAWAGSGCHVIAVHYHTDRQAAWRELRDRLRFGTEPCDEPECENCVEG